MHLGFDRLCIIFVLLSPQRLSHAFCIAPCERLLSSQTKPQRPSSSTRSTKRSAGSTRSSWLLSAVSASQQDESAKTVFPSNEDSSDDEEDGVEDSPRKSASLNFPWDEAQQWALRDQVPRFTIQVVNEAAHSVERYVLWRNLAQSTPELAGYPLPFLADRLENSTISRTIIPYLDSFHFETSGGLSGKVYGVSGVADGTRIETTPVGSVQETIPQSYVQSGAVLYELGNPRQQEEVATSTETDGLASAAIIAKKVTTTAENSSTMLLDREVINLAGLSATVLAGALAMEALSHHLTVNVFWV